MDNHTGNDAELIKYSVDSLNRYGTFQLGRHNRSEFRRAFDDLGTPYEGSDIYYGFLRFLVDKGIVEVRLSLRRDQDSDVFFDVYLKQDK